MPPSSAMPKPLRERLRQGTVIPAHPLALDANRRLDVAHQRALTRYYIDAGSGGIAVGVHTTQFEIRDPEVGLFKPVLELASATADEACERSGSQVIKIAGVCGDTHQATAEAEFALSVGYHACLLSLAALASSSVPALLDHCREVAAVAPVFGFYLQPAVGGRMLPYSFWREFVEIPNVVAIKMAPFNRYQTFDVVRAVCDAGREQQIALYTGNDDNLVLDLLTPYRVMTSRGATTVRIVGGLLGHWAVWTHRAVELHRECRRISAQNAPVPPALLQRAMEVTDTNAALFDVANDFAGCIAGLHEILCRQGLLRTTHCLGPDAALSPGQADEINRVCRAYPHLVDDEFVAANLDRWLDGG